MYKNEWTKKAKLWWWGNLGSRAGQIFLCLLLLFSFNLNRSSLENIVILCYLNLESKWLFVKNKIFQSFVESNIWNLPLAAPWPSMDLLPRRKGSELKKKIFFFIFVVDNIITIHIVIFVVIVIHAVLPCQISMWLPWGLEGSSSGVFTTPTYAQGCIKTVTILHHIN